MIDHILYNANVITLDEAQPRATALALSGERIIAVGTDDDVLALATALTIRENLNGAVVIPGLTDAHIHWQRTSMALHSINLDGVGSRAAAVEKVADYARRFPDAPILGYGWSQDTWADRQFPTAGDLDPFTARQPAFLTARSGHAIWLNSAALALCGIHADTPNPPGGEIQRGEDGQPTGILLESAIQLAQPFIPQPTTDALADMMRMAQSYAHSLGLTGLHDFDDQPCMAALQVLRERGELGLRVLKNVNQRYFEAMLEMGIRWGFGDDWIRIGGLKLFADGAIGPRTAAMIEPYMNEPDNVGIVVVDKETMLELAGRASAAGLPSTIHAIGDRAVHDVLDVYAQVRADEAARGTPRSTMRHRIEHVQVIHPDDVNRLAELELVASMQPIHATSDYEIADRWWGGLRTPYAYNPRLQLDRGVVVAFGSDAPFDHIDPIRGLHAAVTRRRADGSPGEHGWHPAARVTVDEALRAYTLAPAYTAGMENRLGKLAAGHLADLVALDRDPYAIPPDELRDLRVRATMVGGRWRYFPEGW